jgi:hypothetical protein
VVKDWRKAQSKGITMYRIIGGDGKEYGPVSVEQLRQWLKEGRIHGQTQVRAEGETGWRMLDTVPGFHQPPPLTPPPPPSPFVSGPPAYRSPAPMGSMAPLTSAPSNYLVPAILCALCCCPLAVVAIVYSTQVNGKFARGDYDGAQKASDSARLWCWICLALGLVLHVIGLSSVPALMRSINPRQFGL